MSLKDRRKSCLYQAERWLKLLRPGIPNYETVAGYIREEMKEGGFTLCDLGITEEEFKAMCLKGREAKARQLLHYLRRSTERSSLHSIITIVDGIHEEVRLGKFNLADIGTSLDELMSFINKKKEEAPA